MRLRLQVREFKFESEKYRKAVLAAMEKQVKRAARAFLRAAIPHVPVVSGQARGMLKPLGRFLKVKVDTQGAVSDRSRGRSVLRGENEGYKGPFIIVEHDRVIFAYSITTLHYRINEIKSPGGRGPSGLSYPWESIKKYGREAFQKELKKGIAKRIPRLKNYIKRSRFRVYK